MLNRFIFLPLILTLTVMYSVSVFSESIAVEDKSNPQAYIDYAKSKQRSEPESAKKALEKAYTLARQQKNMNLVAKAVLEQAQTSKLQKNYAEAQQYLIKAETISASLNDNVLIVDILTNISSVQRYLKNYEESMLYAEKAIKFSRDNNEPALIFKSVQIKGTLHRAMKQYEDSLASFLLAQRYMSGASADHKVKLFKKTASAYNSLNEYESGIRYYNKVLNLYESENNFKEMPRVLIELAKTHSKLGQYSQAIENGKRSLTLAKEYKQEKNILKSLVSLSIVYRKISSYEDALSHGLQAIDIYQKNNDLNGFAASANSIGLVYTHLNQNKNAKNYFNQVLDIPVKNINVKYRAAALRDLGKLFAKEEQYQKGLDISNEAFDIYEKVADKNGVATSRKNIGYFYYKMGRVDESITAYDKAILLFTKIKDVWNVAESKAQLANILADFDIKKSIKLAQDSLKLATDIGAKSIAEQAYSALVLAEEKRENYKQALDYAKRKAALINEIKTDAINKRSAEMYIILDVEKKERAFDILKREKAVISLELDNQDNKLRLLEKEKRINDLQAQNTLIIVSITVVAAVMTLLILGRIYFNMSYRFIVAVIIIGILLLYSVNAQSTDIIKMSGGQSSLDVRSKYTIEVLTKALDVSSKKYGPYEIKIINERLSNDEKRWEVYDGTKFNLTMAMTSPDWEFLTIPIRIPIRRGIGNFRLLAINTDNQERFKKINSLHQLKLLSAGLQSQWIINSLLGDAGFKIVESPTYDGLFRMLNTNRFDFIPRGINEVYDEISLRKDELKKLMVEPHLALYMPQPYYIFVSPKAPRIAERVEFGLEKMIAEGILQKIFNEHFSGFIKKADLSNRTIINIDHKYLSKKTPFDRKEFWLKFDIEQP